MKLTPKNKHEEQKVVPLFQSGDYFFERGIEAYRKNHLHRAIKLFERAVKITSKEPVFHVQLAAVLSEIGEYERSNDILQQVLAEKGDHLAECYFFLASNYAYLGLFERAEQAIKRYLELHPNEQFSSDALELQELIRFEREQDDWDELDVLEDELIIRHERARYLLRKGEIEEAIPILEMIIKDHPTYWAAMNHLAEAHFRLGDDVAFDMCEKILDQDKGNLFAICNVALFYTLKGETRQAEPFIKALKRVYPIDTDHYIKVAETLCTVGEYRLAYVRLKELSSEELALRPALLYCIGVSLIHLGDQSKAQSYITRAAKLNCVQAVDYLYKKRNDTSSVDISYDMWTE